MCMTIPYKTLLVAFARIGLFYGLTFIYIVVTVLKQSNVHFNTTVDITRCKHFLQFSNVIVCFFIGFCLVSGLSGIVIGNLLSTSSFSTSLFSAASETTDVDGVALHFVIKSFIRRD